MFADVKCATRKVRFNPISNCPAYSGVAGNGIVSGMGGHGERRGHPHSAVELSGDAVASSWLVSIDVGKVECTMFKFFKAVCDRKNPLTLSHK